jgi:hypothetical protein
MAIDLQSLWDYSQPELSAQRFTSALEGASAEDGLILRTQIARTHGLRRDFAKARELLRMIEPDLASGSDEGRVRYLLELGRTFASATHTSAERTPEHLEQARSLFMRAHELATRARLDDLAIDALHMMPFVDSEPEAQLAWNERALATLERSDQAEARRWEASLRNNVGWAMHLKGEYDAAIHQFVLSREAHARAHRTRGARIASWMIARTLRAQGKLAEAIGIQVELERAWDADGETDPYVFEELEHLYRATGCQDLANEYAARLKSARGA